MDTGLHGRAAVVGGGSRGLGRATAEALAAEGCRMLLWSRDPASLERARAEIADRHGVEVHVVAADARDPAAAAAVVAASEEALAAVDICVLLDQGECRSFDLHALRPGRFAEGDLTVEPAVL